MTWQNLEILNLKKELELPESSSNENVVLIGIEGSERRISLAMLKNRSEIFFSAAVENGASKIASPQRGKKSNFVSYSI